MREVPIDFVERELGDSKMSQKIVVEALWRVTVWGAQDKVNLPAGAEAFGVLAHQETVIFEDCGHWAQWEHAEKFNELVIDFLK